ncbi:FAD-dependent oxidoreductase [Streptomyces scopuliridis]|uniref:FAD-dependent oxidoreductase n=1 Tax=Streptomyces scopuliridis TaxID=452529 RepID=UPI0036B4F3E1
MQRILIVGGGIIGALHAWEARKRGFDVIHLESDLEPRSALPSGCAPAPPRSGGPVWHSRCCVVSSSDCAVSTRAERC